MDANSDTDSDTNGGIVYANGLLSRDDTSASTHRDGFWTCLRDFGGSIALVCIAASLLLEDWKVDSLAYRVRLENTEEFEWRKAAPTYMGHHFWTIVIGIANNMLIATMVSAGLFVNFNWMEGNILSSLARSVSVRARDNTTDVESAHDESGRELSTFQLLSREALTGSLDASRPT